MDILISFCWPCTYYVVSVTAEGILAGFIALLTVALALH